ncbi:MAG: molecular chaperone HtpG [Desulfuromonadaceae bacterium]|nr:molecular chaperone HtpG [Desulfuromonadaceae bacterium]
MAKTKDRETGRISIHTENIFPIIKKWLYSEKEIFLRELVSNAVDAIKKLSHINLVDGLQLSENYAIDITLDKDAGTLTISDNGVGMNADEIRRYINQIAFSSVAEYVEKYSKLAEDNQIIGHFGLGFYSAFMVAKKVEIRSLSYLPESVGAHWSCDGSTKYQLSKIDKAERGTEIVLFLEDGEKDFLEPVKVREVLERYCKFLPVPIRLAGEQINDCNPLWNQPSAEIDAATYKEFYRKLYPFCEDPLFWIHFNVDFPFNLKGILYFPRLNNEFDVSRSHIKLYCNQVFVSDSCAELIPEFLTPLQGCIDAPDLPLNVSRSYLQNDPQVRKIREVITSRVATKIVELAKSEMSVFGPIWDDIHPFVKFGMMRDDKFSDKVKDHIVYRTTATERYTTLPAYLERAAESHQDKVYYATDETAQASYLRLFAGQGIEVLLLDAMIDNHFIQFLEMKNSGVSFLRVDSELAETLVGKQPADDIATSPSGATRSEQALKVFRDCLPTDLDIKGETLHDASIPALLMQSEQKRRLSEMTRMMGHKEGLPAEHQLLVNHANPIVRKIAELNESGRRSDAEMLVAHVYDLAQLAAGGFNKERMEQFLVRSYHLLELVNPE